VSRFSHIGIVLQIVEGIHLVDEASKNIAHSNVYLIENGKELLVVDTGTKGNAQKIVNYIRGLGRQPNEVSTIILTHYHMDHAGSAKDLKTATGAKVAASADDAEVISGKKPYPKPKNLLMRASSFMKPPPVEVEIMLKEGDKIGDFTILSTPGHTPGSIMLFDKQKGILFSADTLRFKEGKISGAPGHFTWDDSKEKDSIKRVAGLDFEVMLGGHGEVLKSNASGFVKEFAEQHF
jgi:glyoxylase-like metal-dependent hydrolase (beta-lactamase superfamily II)